MPKEALSPKPETLNRGRCLISCNVVDHYAVQIALKSSSSGGPKTSIRVTGLLGFRIYKAYRSRP